MSAREMSPGTHRKRTKDKGTTGLFDWDASRFLSVQRLNIRRRYWLKIKPATTLDLVVIAAEWGHGRRTGWLSNLHLGARNPSTGAFVMLGKTFKGMTDDMLAWQTTELRKLAIAGNRYTVYVEPKLVVEIAFNDIQASPHYPGGLALRFARVKRYRSDKRAEDADTVDTVRAVYERRLGNKG